MKQHHNSHQWEQPESYFFLSFLLRSTQESGCDNKLSNNHYLQAGGTHKQWYTEHTLRPRPPDQRWVPPSIEVRGNRGTQKKGRLNCEVFLSTRCHGGREERSLQSSCCSGCIQLFQDYDGIYAQFMVCMLNLPLLPNLMISDTIVGRKFSMRLSRTVNGWLCFDLSSLSMESNLQAEIVLMS